MTEVWIWAIALSALVIGGYLFVTKGYERFVARKRCEHWRAHLKEVGTKMPYSDAPFELRHGEKYVLSLKNQQLVEARRGTHHGSTG